MYDTINFRLTAGDAVGVNFLEETSCYLTDIGEHVYSNGVSLSGNLGGLKVGITSDKITVKDRSICKWFMGNNYNSMSRDDVRRAVERLSDELHLPMNLATVTRLDVASNLIMQYPIDVYTRHLGALRYAGRLEQPHGLLYNRRNESLCFYNKNREQRDKGEQIPELYQGKNVLRYEQRYLKRLPFVLKVQAVTGATLYEEDFYSAVVARWRDTYNAISKIEDIALDGKAMKGLREWDRLGRLAYIERVGGELAFLKTVDEQQKTGEITAKQAYSIKQAAKRLKRQDGLTVKSEVIKELDSKIAEVLCNQ